MEEEKTVINENELKMEFSEEEKIFKKECLKNIIRFWKNKQNAQLIGFAKASSLKLPLKAYGDGDKDISEIYFLLASAMKETGYNKEEILNYAINSAHFNRLNKDILWLIRDLKSIYSEDTQLKRIQVKGKLTYNIKSEELTDIFRTIYTVAAESNEEAFGFIKEFERPEITQSMEIVKVFELGPRPELPLGIYETMKLMAWFEMNQ